MSDFLQSLTKKLDIDFSYIKTANFWKELVIMTVGMLISAAAIYYFLLPGKLIIGTISGFAIVVSGILETFGLSIKVSTLITILNVLLLVLAYFLVDKDFGIKNVFVALILGPLMDFWEKVYPYTKLLTEPGQTSVMGDVWFDLCCFVLLLSIGQAVMFRINASTGGLDIVAKIVNKYFHYDIGTSVTICGVLVCITAFAINPFRMVVIGIVGTWINGVVVDYFMASLNKRKRVCIVSDQCEEVRKFIIHELVRGCSIYDVTGGFNGKVHKEIQALLTQEEFAKLMSFIRKNEIPAFITAGNCSEVYGLWLQSGDQKHIRNDQNQQ